MTLRSGHLSDTKKDRAPNGARSTHGPFPTVRFEVHRLADGWLERGRSSCRTIRTTDFTTG